MCMAGGIGMKENFSLSTLGGTSLLLIFSVLCLTVFAVLSLSTAKAGDNLSISSEASVKAYYEADSEAEEILTALRRGDFVEGVEEEDSVYSYKCPINERTSLYVEVMIDGSEYEILRWQSSVDDSMIEESWTVWDGEFDFGM